MRWPRLALNEGGAEDRHLAGRPPSTSTLTRAAVGRLAAEHVDAIAGEVDLSTGRRPAGVHEPPALRPAAGERDLLGGRRGRRGYRNPPLAGLGRVVEVLRLGDVPARHCPRCACVRRFWCTASSSMSGGVRPVRWRYSASSRRFSTNSAPCLRQISRILSQGSTPFSISSGVTLLVLDEMDAGDDDVGGGVAADLRQQGIEPFRACRWCR